MHVCVLTSYSVCQCRSVLPSLYLLTAGNGGAIFRVGSFLLQTAPGRRRITIPCSSALVACGNQWES